MHERVRAASDMDGWVPVQLPYVDEPRRRAFIGTWQSRQHLGPLARRRDISRPPARSWPGSRTDRPAPSGTTWWRSRPELLTRRRPRQPSPAIHGTSARARYHDVSIARSGHSSFGPATFLHRGADMPRCGGHSRRCPGRQGPPPAAPLVHAVGAPSRAEPRVKAKIRPSTHQRPHPTRRASEARRVHLRPTCVMPAMAVGRSLTSSWWVASPKRTALSRRTADRA